MYEHCEGSCADEDEAAIGSVYSNVRLRIWLASNAMGLRPLFSNLEPFRCLADNITIKAQTQSRFA